MNQLIENVIVSAAAAVLIAKARLIKADQDPMMFSAISQNAFRDYSFAMQHLKILKTRHRITNEDIYQMKPKVLAVARKMLGEP